MNIDYNALNTMSIAKLNQRITIQHPSFTDDGEGHQSTTYGDSADDKAIWASVRAYAAIGTATDTEERNETTYVVIVRYQSAIYAKLTTECYVLYDGAGMEIIGKPVDADGRHVWVSMQCRMISADSQVVGTYGQES